MPIGTTNSPGGVRNTKALPIVKNFGSTREQSANLWTLSLADSVTPVDDLAKNIKPVEADSITSSDGITSKTEGLNKSDSVTSADAITSKTEGLNKSDSVTGADAVAKLIKPVEADSVTSSDAIVKSPKLNKTDSVTGSDIITSKAQGLSKSDSVTSSDAIAKTEGLNKSDSVTGSDVISKTEGLNKTDSVTSADAVAKSEVLLKTDSVTGADAIAKRDNKLLADSTSLADLISEAASHTLTLSDSVTSSDSVVKKVELNKSDLIHSSDHNSKSAEVNSSDINIFIMSFRNRIRLPFQLIRPQYPETRQVFRKSDDTIKNLSTVIQKKYEGETDVMPARWHERLVIAFGHDIVNVESDQYVGAVSKDGEYAIDWPKFLDFPVAKGGFFVLATPFDGTNSNCMSCAEASQLGLMDDAFPDPLEEDTDYELQVNLNDNICCFPFVFTVTSFDSVRLSSATIDQTGLLTVHTKTGLTDASNIKLVTYRVTCSDGGYDEADVIGSIDGTVTPPCADPLNVASTNEASTSIDFTFDPPSPTPDHYHWQLYLNSVLTQQGDVAASPVNITGLTEDTGEYEFFLRSQCDATNDDGTASNYIELDFTTPPSDEACGFYNLIYNCPLCSPTSHINVSYIDCDGNLQTAFVFNGVSRGVCALQTSPGSPTYINAGGDPNFHFTLHHSPC